MVGDVWIPPGQERDARAVHTLRITERSNSAIRKEKERVDQLTAYERETRRYPARFIVSGLMGAAMAYEKEGSREKTNALLNAVKRELADTVTIIKNMRDAEDKEKMMPTKKEKKK